MLTTPALLRRDTNSYLNVIVDTLFLHTLVYMALLYIHVSYKQTASFYVLLLWPMLTFLSLINYVIPVLEMVIPSLFFAYNFSVVCAGVFTWNMVDFKSKSLFRKIFHLMCLFLYLFDYYYFDYFILSLTIVFYIMLILEFTRFGSLHLPNNSHLSSFKRHSILLSNYLSHILYAHEQQTLITSHIELLIGCSLGYYIEYVFFYPVRYPLAHAGLSCIGVGDSMASWVGQYSFKIASLHLDSKKLEKLRWPGSNKTILGSAAFFASSFIFIKIITQNQAGEGNEEIEWKLYTFSLFIATLSEIYTVHDNIISPVMFYITYHAINGYK
eukprot:NODE_1_length_95616_cov_0.657642.p30 type:complete len:327 gc:universal NODE_1_length_95616_cov_0.657642:36731-37711(+)